MGVDVKNQLQLIFGALDSGSRHHIHQHRGDHVLLLGRSQGALRDFGIIQNIADMVGKALARQLDGLDILPDLRGNVLFQDDLADAHHHIDGGPELVGNIGKEGNVLPPCCFQLFQHPGMPVLLCQPAVDAVPGDPHRPKDHHAAQNQAHDHLGPHIGGDGVQDEAVVKEDHDIQSGRYI